jgi:hypothetical protein
MDLSPLHLSHSALSQFLTIVFVVAMLIMLFCIGSPKTSSITRRITETVFIASLVVLVVSIVFDHVALSERKEAFADTFVTSYVLPVDDANKDLLVSRVTSGPVEFSVDLDGEVSYSSSYDGNSAPDPEDRVFRSKVVDGWLYLYELMDGEYRGVSPKQLPEYRVNP